MNFNRAGTYALTSIVSFGVGAVLTKIGFEEVTRKLEQSYTDRLSLVSTMFLEIIEDLGNPEVNACMYEENMINRINFMKTVFSQPLI